MRIFGCVDLTANKKNTTHSGEEFVVATPSPALADALNQSTENLMALEKKAALPAPIAILQVLCFFIGACCFIGLLRADVPVQVAYQNAPWVFWAGGICLILWGILLAIGKVKKKKVMDSDEGQQTAEHFDGVTNSIWNEYGVPNYALDVDVLSFCFKQKDGQVKPVTKASATTAYNAWTYRAYRDQDNLYLVDLNGKYAIPFVSLRRIRTVQKRIAISGWNKEVPTDDPRFKPYKIATDRYGRVSFKPYHILEIEQYGEQWELWFPGYELPALQAITGLTAE